jgi:serine/threonine-protein kinase
MDGRPRIADFGLATVEGIESLTRTGPIIGTVGYMSPEQVEGNRVDERSDLFSLGVVLYEAVTGRAPFKRVSDMATLKAITEDAPEPLARYKSTPPMRCNILCPSCWRRVPTCVIRVQPN